METDKKYNAATREALWLKYYLAVGEPTYMNATASVRAAGFQCKSPNAEWAMGARLKKRHLPAIKKWLDEEGLSEEVLKSKLAELLEAKETKYFSAYGKVTDERTGPDKAAQLKALDMAFKVRGVYAAEKHEIAGKDGGPIENVMRVVYVSAKTAKENEDLL